MLKYREQVPDTPSIGYSDARSLFYQKQQGGMMFENPKRDALIGTAMALGGILIIVGIVITFALYAGGAFRTVYSKGTDSLQLQLAFSGLYISFLGMLIFIGALGYGFWKSRERGANSPQLSQDGIFVVAKYAYNERGEMVMYEDQYNEKTKFYTRIAFPSGQRAEMRCHKPLFDQLAEGVQGDILYQGDWLTQFTPVRRD